VALRFDVLHRDLLVVDLRLKEGRSREPVRVGNLNLLAIHAQLMVDHA
jgi:hypothetical protein